MTTKALGACSMSMDWPIRQNEIQTGPTPHFWGGIGPTASKGKPVSWNIPLAWKVGLRERTRGIQHLGTTTSKSRNWPVPNEAATARGFVTANLNLYSQYCCSLPRSQSPLSYTSYFSLSFPSYFSSPATALFFPARAMGMAMYQCDNWDNSHPNAGAKSAKSRANEKVQELPVNASGEPRFGITLV